MGDAPPRRASRPRGFMLMEIAAGIFLFGVALLVLLQLLAWIGSEQRAAQDRRWAIREAENVLERVTALPRSSLNEEALAALDLADRAGAALRGGRLEVALADETGPPASKRVTVAVRWLDRAGNPVAPVRLTAWVRDPPEDRP